MTVGDIKKKLDMPSSTLSHHIAKLVQQGLIRQERQSRTLLCCCNYKLMDELMHYLSDMRSGKSMQHPRGADVPAGSR